MIDPKLLEILCCPETRQDVSLAPDSLVAELNARAEAGTLVNRGGQTVREKMEADMVELGLPFIPERHFLSIQQHDPGMLEDGLRRVFKQRVPTALLLTARQQFATVSGLLAECRMAVPRDVSIVLLLPDGLEDWNVPRLAHFSPPVVADIAKAVRNWIDHPPADPSERIRITSELIEAGSIAPMRRCR